MGDLPQRKIIIVGDMDAGKTSLLHRVCMGKMPSFLSSTIGFEFSSMTFNEMRYNFWDTAGCERFRSLIPQYYRGIHMVWVVVDGSDDDAPEHARYWVAQSRVHTDVPILLIVNKKDIEIKHQWLSIAAGMDVPFVYGSALMETRVEWLEKLEMFLPKANSKKKKKEASAPLCIDRESGRSSICC